MNEKKLSERLAVVAESVPLDGRLADIGSDHAYLPAWLVLNDKIDFAVAGEVVEGPYQSAKQLVDSLQLDSKITVRLADGLEAVYLEDHISVITICGMGGKLIRDILEKGKRLERLSGNERLILQPNIGEQIVRTWLQQNGYQIMIEHIVEEDHKTYEVIVAEKQEMPAEYSEAELLFGPVLLTKKGSVFLKKWAREREHRLSIIGQLEKAKQPNRLQIEQLKKEIQWIEELIG